MRWRMGLLLLTQEENNKLTKILLQKRWAPRSSTQGRTFGRTPSASTRNSFSNFSSRLCSTTPAYSISCLLGHSSDCRTQTRPEQVTIHLWLKLVQNWITSSSPFLHYDLTLRKRNLQGNPRKFFSLDFVLNLQTPTPHYETFSQKYTYIWRLPSALLLTNISGVSLILSRGQYLVSSLDLPSSLPWHLFLSSCKSFATSSSESIIKEFVSGWTNDSLAESEEKHEEGKNITPQKRHGSM